MPKDIPPFEKWPFRVPNIQKAVEKDKELIAALRSAATPEEALAIWKKHAKLQDALETEVTLCNVLFSIDTKNKKYKAADDKLNNELPLIIAVENQWSKALLETPHRPYLEQKLGGMLFTMYDFQARSFSEEIVQESIEENTLSSQYSELLAGAEIPFRGGVYNTSQMGKFLTSKDRETRKEASVAYYGYLDSVKDQLEDIYDKLVKVRDKMAKKLGFKNYIELGYLRMQRFDYDAKDVAFYREQIKEFITPIAGKIMQDQFKRTKIRDPHAYDMGIMFLEGNPEPLGDTETKIESAKKMYDELSPETSYFFRFMADHHVLDLEAKPGKQVGGYMTYFPKYKIPFIFSNFNGTSGDVDVLTHEFGHSFQAYMARNIRVPEYRSPTMESAEIDSMSMEFFAEPWMDLFFDDPLRYRYQHLADSISFLPYGVTVDEFQHWVYENPEATPAERDAKWHELELKYTPYKVACYKENAYLAGGHRWLTQSHIFGSPFYYIDYTLAQVMAFQFFNLDRKNHALAWKRYLKLCAMGGKYPFRTLVTRCGMKDPFQEGVIKKTVAPLMKQLRSYGIK